LDIGGESTRPGAEPVPAAEELRRVLPVLESLAPRVSIPLSIDTYKPEVARAALAAGASIINDVTGFRDPGMLSVAAASTAACVCMHMLGTPQTMASLASYDDPVADLAAYFRGRMEALIAAGVDQSRIVLDPGIGFAKKTAHNLAILRNLHSFHSFGRPLLLGASRKRILGDLTGRGEAGRLPGSIATALAARLQGVHIVRVHDVAAIRDALAVFDAVVPGASPAAG
ncbi:MAG TPA: dihydropteroate synthase, partial [Planctomycetia bacterium]|nr:dihydropteroate synthase [Planctomycetia bacterium]